jgi:hypothetical protein
MLGSNDKTPLAAIALWQTAFSLPGIKSIPRKPGRQHLAFRRRSSQQPIVKKVATEIHIKFQLVNGGVDAAANLAAFDSACPLVIAALRGACHPDKSIPAMPKCNSGTGFLAAQMKEYDA